MICSIEYPFLVHLILVADKTSGSVIRFRVKSSTELLPVRGASRCHLRRTVAVRFSAAGRHPTTVLITGTFTKVIFYS